MVTKLVLIIDDNVDVRLIFGAILNFDGYHVVEAVDGRSGVDAALKHIPEIILMDMTTPQVDGYAAATEIRENETTRNIPMIAVTANLQSNIEYVRGGRLFEGYLEKPITPSTVLAEVHRLIGAPHE